MFHHRLYLNDSVDRLSARLVAEMLREASPDVIVLQGFPLNYSLLFAAFKELNFQADVLAIWHGSFLQAEEDYAWASFQRLIYHHKIGDIRKIGFVKKGMAEVLRAAGLKTGFVMNKVNEIPRAPSVPFFDEYLHLGIWGLGYNWRKLPYSMLASFIMNPDWTVHVSGATPRIKEFLRFFSIRADVQESGLPHGLLLEMLGKMHLNLYVTLSECAPMLPLESLSRGAPCLIGPNSHYFEDDEFLRSRLVVPYPDKAAVISNIARQAIEERDLIVLRYQEYAPAYNERAENMLKSFLDG